MPINSKDLSHDSFFRFTGICLILRAIIFFMLEIGVMYSYATANRIDAYSLTFFCPYLYFAFTVILGLKLCGVYLGSDRAIFLSRLKSFNFSKSNPSTNKKQNKPTMLSIGKRLSARCTIFLLAFDLCAVIALELTIPELPKFYSVLIIEFVAIALAFLDNLKNS